MIKKEMISDYLEFNNCGEFYITIDGEKYFVKFDSCKKEVYTKAPIKEEIRKWFFLLED